MFTILDGRECFYQWDTDRKLIVHDESIKEVHFCNRIDENSLVCEVYTENELHLVNVPNVLLQDNYRISVYGYDENYTKHSKQFYIVSRSKPADYIYTETEIKNYSDLESRLEALESRPAASDALYYTSLFDAVDDMTYYTTEKAIADEAAAKIKVVKEGKERYTISLLDNVSETEKIVVYDNVDIYLNGCEINLTDLAMISFAANAAIYNGSIKKSGNATKSTTAIQAYGNNFICDGVTFDILEKTANKIYAVYIMNGCRNARVSNCNITLKRTSTSENGMASAIVTFPSEEIKHNYLVENCTIDARATTNSNVAGIYNQSTMTIKNCNIYATMDDESGNYAAKAVKSSIGAEIYNCNLKAETAASNVFTLEADGKLIVDNSTIEAKTTVKGNAWGIFNSDESGYSQITNSTVKASYLGDNANTSGHGMFSIGVLKASNTTFFGDAKGGNVEGVPFAIGLATYGTAYLDNCNVTGVHCGCQQGGNAYINGGTFIGTVHGGIYISNPEKETFINDVDFYDARYEGAMPEVWEGRLHSANCWGAVYIGGSGKSGIVANFDNCSFNGCKHSICMRGSLGEKNNTANLSNCTFGTALNGKECTVNFHNNTHTVNVGFGTNFTEEHIYPNEFDKSEAKVNYTNKLYRKHNSDYVLKGADFEALTNYIMA